MKKIFITSTILFASFFHAQTNTECEKLKMQVENQKVEITELSKQNLYYKQTLNLLKPIASSSKNGIQIDILKITGSKSEKKLRVIFVYKNTDSEVRKYFQINNAHFVDPQGNQASTFEILTSNLKRTENILPNIPMKGIMEFDLKNFDNLDFPIMRILDLKFGNIKSSSLGLETTMNFENIPVIWI